MKSVRLYFKKGGRMRFISHLDMNRFMTRIVRRAGIPIWYTEGFNPHPYITFALPLSLGFTGEYEIMDLRLNDDEFTIERLPDILNAVCPEYIRFFEAAEPILKTGAITYASYEVTFDDGGKLSEKLAEFLKRDSIPVLKRTKKGDMKEDDIAPKITEYFLDMSGENTRLNITLPAGGADNLNPELLITEFLKQSKAESVYHSVTRTAISDADKKLFR